MSFVFGNVGEERNEKQEKKRNVPLKEICVYSGEKCVLSCYGTVEASSEGVFVRIIEQSGYVYTVYNGTVVVKENLKKTNMF